MLLPCLAYRPRIHGGHPYTKTWHKSIQVRQSNYMIPLFSIMGCFDQAIAYGQRTLALAEALSDFPLQVQATYGLGDAYRGLGGYLQALEILSQTVVSLAGEHIRERFGMARSLSVFARGVLSDCLADLGQFAEGIACAEEAVRMAEAIDHPHSLVRAWATLGGLYCTKGDFYKAIPVLEQGLDLCQSVEIRTLLPWVTSRLGRAYTLSGRVAEALPLLEQAVEQATCMGRVAYHSLRVAQLANAYLLAGQIEKALPLALCALDLARSHQERGHQAWLFRLLGEIAAHRDPPEGAPAEAYY